jgi:hypothetical protein
LNLIVGLSYRRSPKRRNLIPRRGHAIVRCDMTLPTRCPAKAQNPRKISYVTRNFG